MGLNEEQKVIKKELATQKRKISELAGQIHDIVEDTLWYDYAMLPELSQKIQISMKEMLDFKAKHDFLK
ncbi:CCE_0567 family metalloprotein [Sulfurospirillum arcachonense]|uniref:CCE_0567 family metalloprotein n=1 Tax=Sulfurospirillum arcachonense TaxID=57666 RepID=UPI000469A4CB|nr:CCE_0567 family metalloprotein [Sulfurospirillum arcachonense]